MRSIAFSPDCSRLVSAGDGKNLTIQTWDLATGQAVSRWQGHGEGVNRVASSRGGDRLASTGFDKVVKVWAATGQELLTLTGHASPFIEALAFSPDGQRLASGTVLFVGEAGKKHPPEVKVWDLATGKEHLGWRVPGSISSIAFSPDGRRLFTPGGVKEGMVTVWDATTGEQVSHFGTALGLNVNYLALSPKGYRLATDFGGGEIQLWDVATGSDVLVLRGTQ